MSRIVAKAKLATVITITGAALVILALGIMITGALGLFTDQESVGSNSFSTGTLDLSANPASALVTFSNMAPGDSVTGQLTLTNSGTLQLRYAMTTSATNDDAKNLRDQLQLTIKTLGTDCNTFDGIQLYTGTLASGVIGDAAQGAQAGDRTLAAQGSESLCFRVQLPLSTGNSFQNAATTATFTFQAEQTANN